MRLNGASERIGIECVEIIIKKERNCMYPSKRGDFVGLRGRALS